MDTIPGFCPVISVPGDLLSCQLPEKNAVLQGLGDVTRLSGKDESWCKANMTLG